MRTHSMLNHMAPDAKGAATMPPKPTTPSAPATTMVAAPPTDDDDADDMTEGVNLGASVDPAAVGRKPLALKLDARLERLVPFEVRGFQLDPGSRQYDRKQGDAIVGKSMRLANVVLAIKGCPEEAPYFFLANISRITSNGTAKPRITLSLPSNMKGGGAYASAILKCPTPAGKAAAEAWKTAVITGPFATWIQSQDMTAFVKNTEAATNVGVEMEIPGLNIP